MTADRKPASRPNSLGQTLAFPLLALACSLTQAGTSGGSLLFDLSRPDYAAGSINLGSVLPDLSHMQFSSVRATFSAQILGGFYTSPAELGDYRPLSQQRRDWGLPNCASSSQYWCVDEQIVFERSQLATATQSDAWLRASIAGVAARASVAESLTAGRLEDLGVSLDSVSTSLRIEPFSTDYDADGQVIRIRYSDWHSSTRYQTHSFVQWVYSPLSELSVTLELGADELARLSEQGLLRFDFGHSVLSNAPTLRLDYVASVVPEPQAWLQLAAGLMLLATAVRRRIKSRHRPS